MTVIKVVAFDRRAWIALAAIIGAVFLQEMSDRGRVHIPGEASGAVTTVFWLVLGVIAAWAVVRRLWVEFIFGLVCAGFVGFVLLGAIQLGWLNGVVGQPLPTKSPATFVIVVPGSKVQVLADNKPVHAGKVLVIIVARHIGANHEETIEAFKTEASLGSDYVPGTDATLIIDRDTDDDNVRKFLAAYADTETVYILDKPG
jgi:hypothetical protein